MVRIVRNVDVLTRQDGLLLQDDSLPFGFINFRCRDVGVRIPVSHGKVDGAVASGLRRTPAAVPSSHIVLLDASLIRCRHHAFQSPEIGNPPASLASALDCLVNAILTEGIARNGLYALVSLELRAGLGSVFLNVTHDAVLHESRLCPNGEAPLSVRLLPRRYPLARLVTFSRFYNAFGLAPGFRQLAVVIAVARVRRLHRTSFFVHSLYCDPLPLIE